MRTDWDQLLQATVAAQLAFLDSEAETGITLARIALKATDRERACRTTLIARKAYDAMTFHIADLPPKTPGLEGIREKMVTLRHMLHTLGDRT